MRRIILAIFLCCLIVTVCMGTPPTVSFPAGFPGLRADFVADAYPGPGEDGYGYVTFKTGWTHDGWSGYTSASGAFARFETTMQNDPSQTAMQEDVDWIFSASYQHSGDAVSAGQNPIFAKYDWDLSREDRMFMLQSDGNGLYKYRIGNDSGGWIDVATGLDFSTWKDITIHYKAGVGIDFWYGNQLVATNQTTGHGRYDVDFFQIEYTGAGTDHWRAFKLGHVAPVCGDDNHPYPEVGDFNKDCIVNFLDFVVLTRNWLDTSEF